MSDDNLTKMKKALEPYLEHARSAMVHNPIADFVRQQQAGGFKRPAPAQPAPHDVLDGVAQIHPMTVFGDARPEEVLAKAGQGAADFFNPDIQAPKPYDMATRDIHGAHAQGYGEPSNFPQPKREISPRMRTLLNAAMAARGQAPAVTPDTDTGISRPDRAPLSIGAHSPAQDDEWVLEDSRPDYQASGQELSRILAKLEERYPPREQAALTSYPAGR
jgi:hypothetical protein